MLFPESSRFPAPALVMPKAPTEAIGVEIVNSAAEPETVVLSFTVTVLSAPMERVPEPEITAPRAF